MDKKIGRLKQLINQLSCVCRVDLGKASYVNKCKVEKCNVDKCKEDKCKVDIG